MIEYVYWQRPPKRRGDTYEASRERWNEYPHKNVATTLGAKPGILKKRSRRKREQDRIISIRSPLKSSR